MNVRHPKGALHSFSIKNIFYDKIDFRPFYFHVKIYGLTGQRQISVLSKKDVLLLNSAENDEKVG